MKSSDLLLDTKQKLAVIEDTIKIEGNLISIEISQSHWDHGDSPTPAGIRLAEDFIRAKFSRNEIVGFVCVHHEIFKFMDFGRETRITLHFAAISRSHLRELVQKAFKQGITHSVGQDTVAFIMSVAEEKANK